MEGTARFKDFAAYLEWYSGLSIKGAKEIKKLLESYTKTGPYNDEYRDAYNSVSEMFDTFTIHTEEKWIEHKEGIVDKIKQFLAFSEEYGQSINVSHFEPNVFAHLYYGNPKGGIIVPTPEKYLEYTPKKDYSAMTPQQVRLELGAAKTDTQSNIVPAEAETTLTTASIKEQLSGQDSLLKDIEHQMEDVKNAKGGELAELKQQMEKIKAELDAKKAALMTELRQKKAEMEEIKENLEQQIYMLDSQIYAIRCFAGEIVNFAKIKSGKDAPNTEPIVIYQKLRFLDEDLGRLASLYEIQWDHIKMFEDFLKYSPVALDTFAPNNRCIMLIRLSRTGKRIGEHNEPFFDNMMKEYEYYHGKTIGIIIRNGENLYLGWTDENRVHISDDLIITPAQIVTTIQPEPEPEFQWEPDREKWIQKQKENRKTLLDGLISRSFIYNILQGIIEHSSILPLPSGVTLGKQSEYVKYSVADKWITDNRFDGFNDIIKRCNLTVQRGDMLLTVRHLIPKEKRWDGHYGLRGNNAWENVRGRGEKNRTHDCSIADCTIYPVNLVEYDEPVEMVKYNSAAGEYCGWITRKDNVGNLCKGVRIIEEFTKQDRHVFVSVEKRDVWYYGRTTDKPSRANFEVYDDEFINLTYMNSVWLEYVITNQSLGGWSIGGVPVNYAFAIRYLKKAMDFVRAREAKEKALIDAIEPSICEDAEWPLKLSEWKMGKGVREITEYQAKRFAKEFKQ